MKLLLILLQTHSVDTDIYQNIYCRPPEFTVTQPGKYLAGGLQSGHTVSLIGVQYILLEYRIQNFFTENKRLTFKTINHKKQMASTDVDAIK